MTNKRGWHVSPSTSLATVFEQIEAIVVWRDSPIRDGLGVDVFALPLELITVLVLGSDARTTVVNSFVAFIRW